MWIVRPSPGFVGGTTEEGAQPGPETSPRRTELSGAINETVSFQFAVRTGAGSIRNPRFRIAPFTSSTGKRIDPAEVELFRMHRVAVGSFPGWHVRSILPGQRDPQPLDVLVPVHAPRGGLPAPLLPGETYDFWVDVTIPKGTFEGTYTTEIELTSGEVRTAKVAVQLTVWPIVLPDEADIQVISEVDHRQLFRHHVRYRGRPIALSTNDWRDAPMRRELDALLRSTVRLLQSHRLTPVLDKLTPVVKVNARGAVTIDWVLYDSVVEPYLNGRAFFNRVPLRRWPIPLHAVLSPLTGGNSPGAPGSSPGHTELLRQYLTQCARHFAGKGWLDRSYCLVPSAVDPSVESTQAMRDFAAVARSADERLAIVSRLWPQDMAPYGWVDYALTPPAAEKAGLTSSEAVDIWLPPAQFYDPPTMAGEREAGRNTWLAVDRPPYSGSIAVHAPPAYVRVLTWQADQLGAEALYLGCTNKWPAAESAEDCVRADPNVLLYPGGPFGLNEPVASVRLKHLRRSLQDAAYRRLLNDHGLEHVTTVLARSLAPYAGSDAYRTHFADGRPIGFVDDWAMFDLARDIMVGEIIDASYGERNPRRSESFARIAAWRRFMLATRKLHLSVDGTRIRLMSARTTWEAQIECALTIVNRTRMPVAGTIRFVEPPSAQWVTVSEDSLVASIEPNSSRRVTLTARAIGRGGPTGPSGFISLPIEFTTEDEVVHRCQARASYITAVPFDGLIRIDGDLSDWPPTMGNVASEFRLIVPDPTESVCGGLGEGATHPHHSTRGLVMRDSKYLYIAINSEFDGRAFQPVPREDRVNSSEFRRSAAEPAKRFDISVTDSPRARMGLIKRDNKYLYVAINNEFDDQTLQPASRGNRVDYDDLVPVGEELVEILIDPLNAGTRSPSDLYHIVIKPSGTYLTEKGIRFEPPCGRRAPWPADLEVSSQVSSDRWTVELRIPLASFDPETTEPAIWGLNITRYDALREEFSTWSGATGNAYDPKSLGNLYLP